MSADVTVVENSLTSSIDMLIRNPIALLVCFVTLFSVSWQMTLLLSLFTSDRLDNGGCQPEAEKTVLYSTGAMGRYYVPIG